MLKSITGGTSFVNGAGSGTQTDDSIWEIRTVPELSRIEAYDDNARVGTLSYDLTHNYEIRSDTTATCSTKTQGSSTGRGDITFHHINATGVRGVELGNLTFGNGTFESSDLGNFSDNLTTAKLTWYSQVPSDGAINCFLTNDNSTWEQVSSGITHAIQNQGLGVLRYRCAVNGTSSNSNPNDETTLYRVDLEVSQGNPENITIDLGQDGSVDFEWNGTLGPDNGTVSVNISNSTIQSYLANNCGNTTRTTCRIPIDISTQSSGILNYTGISMNLSFEGIRLLTVNLTNFAKDNTIMNISIRSDTSGIIQLGELDIRYIGEENITVFAYKADDLAINDTQVIQVRYSPFNVTFPYGLTTWEFILQNLTQYNVTPFGQVNDINETNSNYSTDSLNLSYPIFNITTTALIDPVRIVLSLNDTLNSCVNLTAANSLQRANEIILNETDQSIITGLNSSTVNATGIFMWGDFECGAVTQRFFIPTIKFKSYCQDCIFPTDINGLNWSVG